ncbi:MAG TPA: PilZ domain-containing protein [Allosphingosinicella sp.]
MSRDQDIEASERRAQRVSLDEAARLRPNDWSSLEVRMIDISESGFRASCDARLQRGGLVTLDVQGIGSVEAQVEWQRGDTFGARFIAPIDIGKCSWTPTERESVLAQLLIDRAAARRAGRMNAERRLRQRILNTLPMKSGVLRA